MRKIKLKSKPVDNIELNNYLETHTSNNVEIIQNNINITIVITIW
jgi:hypothetical protein